MPKMPYRIKVELMAQRVKSAKLSEMQIWCLRLCGGVFVLSVIIIAGISFGLLPNISSDQIWYFVFDTLLSAMVGFLFGENTSKPHR